MADPVELEHLLAKLQRALNLAADADHRFQHGADAARTLISDLRSAADAISAELEKLNG